MTTRNTWDARYQHLRHETPLHQSTDAEEANAVAQGMFEAYPPRTMSVTWGRTAVSGENHRHGEGLMFRPRNGRTVYTVSVVEDAAPGQ